jgi:hypothetical protein
MCPKSIQRNYQIIKLIQLNYQIILITLNFNINLKYLFDHKVERIYRPAQLTFNQFLSTYNLLSLVI